jgi:flagellin-like hook-associated protein FlgL
MLNLSVSAAARHVVGRYASASNQSGATIGDIIDAINAGSQSRIIINIADDIPVPGAGEYIAFCLSSAETYYKGVAGVVSAETGGGVGLKDAFVEITGTSPAGLAQQLASAINVSSKTFWAIDLGGGQVAVFNRRGGNYDHITAGFETNIPGVSDNVGFINAETYEVTSGLGQFSLGGEHWVKAVTIPTAGEGFSLALVGQNAGDGYDIKLADQTLLNAIRKRQAHISRLDPNAMVQVQDAADGQTTLRTQAAAQRALETITQAIGDKDRIRAGIGATQNRLEATIETLTYQVENLQAAESRISDVDVAAEMTEYTKNNILAQAASSMLAQANSLSSLALTLIRG